MLIESFIIAVLVGLLRKGSLKKIGLIQFKGISLLFVAFAIQFFLDYLGRDAITPWGGYFHIFTYFLLFYFLFINKQEVNFFILAGIMLNFVVIILNGGSMPVKTIYMPTAAVSLLENSVTHSILTFKTNLAWLADILYVKWPSPQMLSIGDIFLDIGVFMYIQKLMKKKS